MKHNNKCKHNWIEHDITFCKAGLCPINKKCYRFMDNHDLSDGYFSLCDFYIEGKKKCKDYMKLEIK